MDYKQYLVHIHWKSEGKPPNQCNFTLSKFPTYFMNVEIETVLGACDLYRFNRNQEFTIATKKDTRGVCMVWLNVKQ